MIQENKEILIKDLCARLSYGVKVLFENKVFSIDYISAKYEEIKLDIPDNYTLDITNVKPYLFPLSSMTRKQLFDVQEIIGKNEIEIEDGFLHIINYDRNTITYLEFLAVFEWFYKNHFDIYGLIPMGLAIDATNLNIY
ncbi:MAG: hypothetical protein [Vetruanivirus porcinprimi]|uniref:Uncharacterized protein n=1 Tax=phage Lak_Megaphage_RVC_AP1_GC26 TaxID=3109224 RepID=A0ABZ0Z755_9CAUD|nr:MAG: hypothetical protein [phage Lak_Megaphage_RVC_AP1_GC26]